VANLECSVPAWMRTLAGVAAVPTRHKPAASHRAEAGCAACPPS